jgi:ATP/maltotriose-dependent transcriptional regulator MalT
VLGLVAQGCSNQQAAECLFVSVATVRKHLEHAYRKLGVANRTAAVMSLRSSA